MNKVLFETNLNYLFSGTGGSFPDRLHNLTSKFKYIYRENDTYIPKDIYVDSSLFIGDYSDTVLDSLSAQITSPDSVSIPRFAPLNLPKPKAPFSNSIGEVNEVLTESLDFSKFTEATDNKFIKRTKPYLLFLGSLSLLHLDKLVDKLKYVRSVIVLEDSLESLHVVLNTTNLEDLKEKLRLKNISITLLIDSKATVHKLQRKLIDHIVSNELLAAHSLQIIKSPSISSSLRAVHTWLHSPEGYGVSIINSLGFTTDEINQSINSIINASSEDTASSCDLYSNQSLSTSSCVLVASGPSLADHLEYLESIKQKAFIVACGSSLAVLLKANIKPSAFILLERNPDVFDDLAILRSEGYDLSDIPLISALGIDYRIPPLFKSTTSFIRPVAIYSEFFISSQKSFLPISGPQVINAACEFVFMHGCRSILLIGADLACSSNKIRTDNAYGVSNRTFDIPIRALDGSTTFTSIDLLHVRTKLESFLSNAKGLEIYRTMYGIPIKYTKPIANVQDFVLNNLDVDELLASKASRTKFNDQDHIMRLLHDSPILAQQKVQKLCNLLENNDFNFTATDAKSTINSLLCRLRKNETSADYFIAHFFSGLVFYILQPLVYTDSSENNYSLPSEINTEIRENLKSLHSLFATYCRFISIVLSSQNKFKNYELSTLIRFSKLIEEQNSSPDTIND